VLTTTPRKKCLVTKTHIDMCGCQGSSRTAEPRRNEYCQPVGGNLSMDSEKLVLLDPRTSVKLVIYERNEDRKKYNY
jgi:hypothetical protein